MSVACLEAGVAFSNAILGAVHALAHPLGGLYDLHHGLVNSVMLPVVLRQNIEHAPDKFSQMARALGVETRGMTPTEAAEHVPEKIEQFIEELELPKRLSQLGVKSEDIPYLAALAEQDICMLTNPCCYSREQLEAMYQEVW
jgi:1,3-propanediol dehydrogenase